MSVPEKLTNFRLYVSGKPDYATATIELPKLEAMTETISAAGIAGEYEAPASGHFKAIKVPIEFLNPSTVFLTIPASGVVSLSAYGNLEVFDGNTRTNVPIVVTLTGSVLTKEGGKWEPAKKISPKIEVDCTYYQYKQNGVVIDEIDKINFVAIVGGGQNLLSEVADNLGLSGIAGSVRSGGSDAVQAAMSKVGI
ncbi:MAG TPA: phage major tail tube protein [Burkholderiales bacterium]|nr:phage major tail tube protein [Burkholderiales bacterium]